MRDERAFLFDMLDSARLACDHLGRQTFEEFSADLKTQDSVVRRLGIIGEAAKHISDSTRNLLPPIQFERMAGMRDRVVHAYWDVDLRIVWETVVQDLPALITALEPLLPPSP